MELERDPQRAFELCSAAHTRLLNRVETLTTREVGRPSRLPEWTVGHVLAHLARNADAHARRVTGALHGADVPKYTNGAEQRRLEIEDGARKPAAEIVGDLVRSVSQLDDVFARSSAAGWPNGHLLGGGNYGVAGCPAHRLREVEMHHVDLGLGYTPMDWPDAYVAWDLPVLLASVASRLTDAAERRVLMAWLAGRGSLPQSGSLTPW